jgi:hypothetical protein
MGTKIEDQMEKWEAMKREYSASQDKVAAENKMAANDAFKHFREEADAARDWAEADWEQFTARVDKWWQSLEIAGHDAKDSMGNDN